MTAEAWRQHSARSVRCRWRCSRWTPPIESYNESLKIRQEIGDRRGVGNTLIELGRGQRAAARTTTRRSTTTASRCRSRSTSATRPTRACARTTSRRSTCWQGRYDDALTYFQQALQIREKSTSLDRHRRDAARAGRHAGAGRPIRSGADKLSASARPAPQGQR